MKTAFWQVKLSASQARENSQKHTIHFSILTDLIIMKTAEQE
jgi:hypothetical protein